MNSTIKDKLKIKPQVHEYEPVVVMLQEEREKEEKEKEQVLVPIVSRKNKTTEVTDDRITDYDRTTLKKRILENKLTTISSRGFNSVEPTPPAPVEKEIIMKPKAKKIPKKLFIIEEEEREEEKEGTEPKEEEAIMIQPKKRVKNPKKIQSTQWVELREEIKERIPEEQSKINLKVSSYYMNNREIFIQFINSLFEPYRKEMEENESNVNCDTIGLSSGDVSLLTHQKVIRDYMNLYTPYRGLLLFHGLGSGKTCSSIAIAEGMKNNKRVVVMTPASLRRNFFEELKKCGDSLYKKNQFWEWIPATAKNPEVVEILSSALHLPKEYIERKKGAWLVNVKKVANYGELSSTDKQNLDEQIDEMIQTKYMFINYNGIRRAKLANLTMNFERNLFDDSVVVIDEAHNFISRIVNKIEREKPIPLNNRGEKETVPKSLSLILYEQLLNAKNVRIVLLTGTPIINYPNEIGILFNILRGYIKTWEIPIVVASKNKVNLSSLQEMFQREKVIDYIDYSPASEKILITRNPFGFKNKIKVDTGYHGVTNERKDQATGKSILDTDSIDDPTFERHVISILKNNGIDISPVGIKIRKYTALPEKLEPFLNQFIDEKTKKVKDIQVFKRRIIGLTSYFRSAQEDLLPRYEKTPQYYHVLYIPMSNYQFKIYEAARKEERLLEKSNKNKKKQQSMDVQGLFASGSSTYRIFSRLFCNFVMPTPPGRPLPREELAMFMEKEKSKIEKEEEEQQEEEQGQEEEKNKGIGGIAEVLKQAQQAIGNQDLTNDEEGEIEGDVALLEAADKTYEQRLQNALAYLKEHADQYLTPLGLETYSPKYLEILQNIEDPDHVGLHLVYSQFRTLEGIGIFKMVLEENGYALFKIKKSASGIWELNNTEEDKGKPMFALYTGTESAEEKEIIRNIYNGAWDFIPTQIANQLRQMSRNNSLGEIIKILMITSSGSEGINLKNTRYVHIMEPYWHPVRTEQVIGRARRICSHKELAPELQTVEVFIYLMTFTEEQKKGEDSIELKLKDLSKREPYVPLTSDEALYEISFIKEEVNSQLVRAIKETAIDCAIYSKRSKEGLKCLTFGEVTNQPFSYVPNIEKQQDDTISQINKVKITWVGKETIIEGVKYVRREMSPTLFNIYDYGSYEEAVANGGEPRLVGTLVIKPDKTKQFIPVLSGF
jgi:hypothetical protein